MGQPIVVIEKPSIANPGMVRFETNRSITGMGHEVYPAGAEVRGDRPPDELARRLLAHGGIAGIHINGSVVTVDLEKGHGTDGLKEIIETLYIHYPPTVDDPEAVADADAPETEGELVEQESAAPVDEAPAPEHGEPVPAAEAAAEELESAAAEDAAAPAADAAAEADEVSDADVQQVEGDAPTTDQAPVGGTPSDPPADAEAPATAPATAPADEDAAPA